MQPNLKRQGTSFTVGNAGLTAKSATTSFINELLAVTVPKTVRIDAPLFGLALRVLQGGVVLAAVFSIISAKSYEKPIAATGTLTEAWIDGSVMTAQLPTSGQEAYCTSPYEYQYEYCPRSPFPASYASEFWCEDNIQCKALDPGTAMLKQSTYNMWAISYLKDQQSTAVSCAAGASACGSGETFQTLVPVTSCQCVKTNNHFIAGAEYLSFGFRPKVRAADGINELCLGDGTVNASLYIKPITGLETCNTGMTGFQRVRNYDKGALISFTAKELLDWAGFPDGLDSVNTQVQTSPPCDVNAAACTGTPSLRITGITFEVRVVFNGSIGVPGSAAPAASIEVTPILGWHSLGDEMPIVTEGATAVDPSSGVAVGAAAPDVPLGTTHINKYKRGIHIDLSFSGSVYVFDPTYFLATLASWVIYISICGSIIQLLLTNLLGYTSKVYRGLTNEFVSVEKVHQQKSAEALVAAAAYLAINERIVAAKAKSADVEQAAALDPDAISRNAVRGAFTESGLSEADAATLMQNVVASIGKLDFDTLANASSATAKNISIDHVSHHSRQLAMGKGENAKRVLPVPQLQPTM